MVVILTCACKNKEYPIKTERARVLTRCSPSKLYGSYQLPCKSEFLSDVVQNLMQPFPHPYDARLHINFECNRPTGLRDFYF